MPVMPLRHFQLLPPLLFWTLILLILIIPYPAPKFMDASTSSISQPFFSFLRYPIIRSLRWALIWSPCQRPLQGPLELWLAPPSCTLLIPVRPNIKLKFDLTVSRSTGWFFLVLFGLWVYLFLFRVVNFHVFIAPVCRISISSTGVFANCFHLFFNGVDYNSPRSLELCSASICWL